MEDDARLGALLSANLRGAPQQTGKALPVGLWRIGIASLGVALRRRSPQHAVADLVARLDEVGRGPLGLQAAQHPARILRQRVGQSLVVEALPCPWRPLLGRVGPGIAIVEVEQETQARLLDALCQGHDIVQVLAHALPLVLCRGMGGLDEEAKAHGVHALAGEEGQGVVDGRTRLVVVFCPLGLVGGKQGDIAPDIALGHGGDRSTQQEGQKKDPFRHKNHFFYFIIPHRTDLPRP